MNKYENKYKVKYVKQVYRYRLLKLDDNEISNLFDINTRTLRRWKKKYPEFKEAYVKGGIEATANVVESLYDKAVGYDHDEEILSNSGKLVEMTKHYPKDFKSIQYFLKNRSDFDEELKLKKKESEFKKEMALKEFELKEKMAMMEFELRKQQHADKMAMEEKKMDKESDNKMLDNINIIFNDDDDDE
jgi:hypothetical protein